MPRNEVRVYRSHRPFRTALIVLVSLLAFLLALAVGVFFGFRRYIVYTSDGVRLEVPWLSDTAPEEGATSVTGTGGPAHGEDGP